MANPNYHPNENLKFSLTLDTNRQASDTAPFIIEAAYSTLALSFNVRGWVAGRRVHAVVRCRDLLCQPYLAVPAHLHAIHTHPLADQLLPVNQIPDFSKKSGILP